LVTIYQFSFPLWLAKLGGWENPEVVDLFMNYTQYVINQLGDLVSDWMTMNDPNLTAGAGYLWGWWPPGKKDPGAMYKAMRHMIFAHIKGYQIIHKIRVEKGFIGTTHVGFAFHARLFDPWDGKRISKLLAGFTEYMFTDMLITGMATGKLGFPLGFGGYPMGKGKFYDFIGVNYFTRNMVRYKSDPKTMFCEVGVKKNANINEGRWEIYPEGLYRCCKKYYSKYQAPIFITENGIRDSTDSKRVKFIYDHIYQITRLIKEGIPVQRYYHWTLIDLFEAHSGERCRLGLVANNFETQERTIRESGRFYGEICKQKAITRDMISKYTLE
jgi:beta-glucosidase